jgi:regulator of protease activity HflC (stomatin/prohibitin superfamily)
MIAETSHSTLGPGAQTVRLSFWVVIATTVLAALMWASSNIRYIPADSRAVVTSFGAFARVQDAGLLLAWPRPFESVELVPGTARVLEQEIISLKRDRRANGVDGLHEVGLSPDALAGSGYLLTGDEGVVHLTATLYYRVSDPYNYVLQRDQLSSALERIVAAAAVDTVARRDVDAILVARPEQLALDQQMAVQRERLRGDLADAIRRHLRALDAAHAGLGVEVARVDVQAAFPDSAMDAFNAVLTSFQVAERSMADARTAAEHIRQGARQDADNRLQNAQASAAERVAKAEAETTTIRQLADEDDSGMFARVYRERVGNILAKAGRVSSVDPRDASNIILPGGTQ